MAERLAFPSGSKSDYAVDANIPQNQKVTAEDLNLILANANANAGHIESSSLAAGTPLIPHVVQDISGYVDTPFDAYTNGTENTYWELTVDLSLSGGVADKIFIFKDDPDFTGTQYNLTNIPLNEVVYFKLDNTETGDPLPFTNFTMEGAVLVFQPPCSGYNFDDATDNVLCFIRTGAVTNSTLAKVIHWSYYIDDFRPENEGTTATPIRITDMGRSSQLLIAGTDFIISSGQLQMNWAGGARLSQMIYDGPDNPLRPTWGFDTNVTEDEYFARVQGADEETGAGFSVDTWYPTKVFSEITLTGAGQIMSFHASNAKKHMKGQILVTPAGNSFTFSSKFAAQTNSASVIPGSTLIIIHWHAYADDLVTYTITNIA